jgi:C1A family cysteine protease
MKPNYLLIWGLTLTVIGCQSKSPDPRSVVSVLQNRKLGLVRTPAERLRLIKTADKRPSIPNAPSRFVLTMPPVEPNGQGNEGSCVAWASTYTARSYPAVASYTTTSGGLNYGAVFSPEYVYNQTKLSADCGQGSYFVSTGTNVGALDVLMQQGACLWKEMPYTDAGCATQPTATQKSLAGGYKINRYEKVDGFSTAELKNLLLSNTPLLIGATVDEGFAGADASFVWKSGKGQSLGGHALVIIGYDDAKNAFRVQNSWGTGWADSGYTWLDYGYYDQVVFEAFILYIN